MSHLLYIKANIKPEGESRTFQVSDYFIKEYKKAYPNDRVTVLDLYQEKIHFLQPKDLQEMYIATDDSTSNSEFLKYARQFAMADKYVFAAPMWNLSFPAILKAYIDYISIPKITFAYTEHGPKGLLANRKALYIVARGGEYDDSSYEMGERYLRTILNFYGILDIRTIALENMDVHGVNTKAKIIEGKWKAQKLIPEF